MSTVIVSADGKARCSWCGAVKEFLPYHDKEWGFPVADDYKLFEKICLEGFQSGLSWRTILAKRDNFRNAFHDFDFERIARFTQRDVNRLLKNEGIVRHKGKIEAVINNAKKIQEVIDREGSFAAYVWQFEPNEKQLAKPQTVSTSPESEALSKALKKQGWKFVGPTTIYAFMQAMGLVNDHVAGCMVRTRVETARKRFKRPRNMRN